MKTKILDNFRARVGNQYCWLSKDYDELGVLIPGATKEEAHVFANLNAANYAVARTTDTQNKVSGSHIKDWPKFKPLLFEGALEIERFQPEAVTA